LLGSPDSPTLSSNSLILSSRDDKSTEAILLRKSCALGGQSCLGDYDRRSVSRITEAVHSKHSCYKHCVSWRVDIHTCMENDLVCNYRKCRKRLTKYAWVTSCSHIFCDDDGVREFSNSSMSHICPACESNLPGKYDVVKTDLQPTDQYKSMVLAGQRPEVIMEVCSRSMAFWTYQSHQERMYQEYVASRAKEKCTQMEQYYQQVVSRAQAEMAGQQCRFVFRLTLCQLCFICSTKTTDYKWVMSCHLHCFVRAV
jgi:E3 ubiquitin-protein ligase CCNP1IP1